MQEDDEVLVPHFFNGSKKKILFAMSVCFAEVR